MRSKPNQEPLDILTNQTLFSTEEPIFEEPPHFGVPQSDLLAIEDLKKPFYLRPVFWIEALLGASLMLIVFSLLFAQSRGQILKPRAVKQPTQQQEQQSVGFLKRIDELNQNFQDADPTKSSLFFPPVDMTIALDEQNTSK